MSICAFSTLQPESIGFTGQNRPVLHELIKVITNSYSTGFFTIFFYLGSCKNLDEKIYSTLLKLRKE